VVAAVNAPSSQPDPMIEPSEMNISAIKPTSRLNPGSTSEDVLCTDVCATITVPFGEQPLMNSSILCLTELRQGYL
jgi:hypothetical protein